MMMVLIPAAAYPTLHTNPQPLVAIGFQTEIYIYLCILQIYLFK